MDVWPHCLQVSDESGQQSPGLILSGSPAAPLPQAQNLTTLQPCCFVHDQERAPPYRAAPCVQPAPENLSTSHPTCWQSWMGSVNGHVCSGCCQAPACAGRAPSSSPVQRQGAAMAGYWVTQALPRWSGPAGWGRGHPQGRWETAALPFHEPWADLGRAYLVSPCQAGVEVNTAELGDRTENPQGLCGILNILSQTL